MKEKKCSDIKKIEARIIASAAYKDITINNSTTNNIAEQLKIIKEMYDAGDLKEEEYKKAKEKVLQ